MRTLAFLLMPIFAACVAFFPCASAAPVPPNAREAAQLVEKLGSSEFAEREAATKRLDELGVLALTDLRGACRSEDPEVAARAKDLLRKIERRIANESLLTATTVELNAKDAALDDVLAELSKRSGYEVVLGGLKVNEHAVRKVTVATGKVPFWAAVQKVCEAGDLQIAGSGGVVAPGSMPYIGRAEIDGVKVRVAPQPERAIVLEARDSKRRPASVQGAVLVEAVELPKNLVGLKPGSAVLQFWPEPRLAWQAAVDLKITKATDGDGRALTADLTPPPRPVPQVGSRLRPEVATDFTPNTRQAVAKFKIGDERPTLARELTGSMFGLVRSAPEPLAALTLDPKKETTATGKAGVEVTASTMIAPDGKKFVDVKLKYPLGAAEPVRVFDELPDVAIEGRATNRTVHGVRVADADGRAFAPSLVNSRGDILRAGWIDIQLTLALPVEEKGPTTPAKVTFWGTTPKPIEVPFALKDVPLK